MGVQFVIELRQLSRPDDFFEDADPIFIGEALHDRGMDQLVDQHENAGGIDGQSLRAFQLLQDPQELSAPDGTVQFNVLPDGDVSSQTFNETLGETDRLRLLVRGHDYP